MHLTCSCVAASSIACFNAQLDDVDGAGFTARDALAEWLAGQQGSQEQAKVCGVQSSLRPRAATGRLHVLL
jgi:hypothetical protein